MLLPVRGARNGGTALKTGARCDSCLSALSLEACVKGGMALLSPVTLKLCGKFSFHVPGSATTTAEEGGIPSCPFSPSWLLFQLEQSLRTNAEMSPPFIPQ